MAGEWIKVDTNLPDKPEVLRIARRLDISKDSVVGKLIRVWGWFDTNSVDGVVDGVVDADIDAIAYQDGFAAALVSVGWLQVDNSAEKVTCPNFERHNGESAKKRALKTERQARWRKGKDAQVVDAASTQASTTASTREEKRRDISIARGARLPKDWNPGEDGLKFASDHGLLNGKAQAELAKFRDYWASQPGQKGVKTDWLATWRNWVRNASTSKSAPQASADPFAGAM